MKKLSTRPFKLQLHIKIMYKEKKIQKEYLYLRKVEY